MSKKLILVLTHNADAPSYRYRIQPLVEEFMSRNIDVQVVELRSKNYLSRIFSLRNTLLQADSVILHKLKLPSVEVSLIHAWNKSTYFEFDDAIYMRQPKTVGVARRTSPSRMRKFKKMCRSTRFALVGNRELAEKASSHGAKVYVCPTGVNIKDYKTQATHTESPRIVWVGLPGNLRYLEIVRPALAKLCGEFDDLRFRVISSSKPDWPDVNIEFVPWSLLGEKQALATSSVGIMPLEDEPYSRGKCAFKLVQYMASGLPCVASPVGANVDAVTHGSTGYLADSVDDWYPYLRNLIVDKKLRAEMGVLGRRKAEQEYSAELIAKGSANFILNNL